MTTGNTTPPRNAPEALHQARRHERAQTLLREGYSFTWDADTKTVFVCKPGRLYAEYTIGEQLTGKDGCSCPDFQKNGIPCKHMAAWQLLQAEQADEDANFAAQCARYDDEEGYLDAIPTPTLMTLAVKDLIARLQADLQTVETSLATHGKTARQLHSGPTGL